MTKTCFKCGVEKTIDDFYAHPAMLDGHLGKCKECTKMDMKLHRIEHLAEVREYDRIRSKTPARKVKGAQASSSWRKRYPERYKAHIALNNAVRNGSIKKPIACEICGYIGPVHGHHTDYSKPLEVVWLCATCHGQIQ